MADAFVPNVDVLVAANQQYSAQFAEAHLPTPPKRQLAIVTCMDARIDVFAVLGLVNGDAHVIRNAGGVVTNDVIRSLTLSQRVLGTREIVLIHHTYCGLEGASEDAIRTELETELGVKPEWAIEAFSDPYVDVKQSIRRLRLSPFVPHQDHISGFVYDVDNGQLHPVTEDA